MSKSLISEIEEYKIRNDINYTELSRRLELPNSNYISRWKKGVQISYVYDRVIREFLRKEKHKKHKGK